MTDETEQAWSQGEAARFCGVDPDTLRKSDCPRLEYPGHGPKGRKIIRYIPAEVRAWRAQFLVRASAPSTHGSERFIRRAS